MAGEHISAKPAHLPLLLCRSCFLGAALSSGLICDLLAVFPKPGFCIYPSSVESLLVIPRPAESLCTACCPRVPASSGAPQDWGLTSGLPSPFRFLLAQLSSTCGVLQPGPLVSLSRDRRKEIRAVLTFTFPQSAANQVAIAFIAPQRGRNACLTKRSSAIAHQQMCRCLWQLLKVPVIAV